MSNPFCSESMTTISQPRRQCTILNCNKKHVAHGYCRNHYALWYRYGKPEPIRYKKRTFIKGKIGFVEVAPDRFAIIDAEDFERITKRHWHIMKNGYISGRQNENSILMHRFILDASTSKLQVDHVNGVRHDNRKKNLRLCTQSQNNANQPPSRFLPKGVYKSGKRFCVKIGYRYKQICLGTYDTPEDAMLAYHRKAVDLFGEFARINTVTDIILATEDEK